MYPYTSKLHARHTPRAKTKNKSRFSLLRSRQLTGCSIPRGWREFSGEHLHQEPDRTTWNTDGTQFSETLTRILLRYNISFINV